MCPKVQKNSPFGNRNMAFLEFKKVIKMLGPTALTIRFWNYGESLINKDLFRMIKLAKKYNLFTVLSTNGVLMDEKASRNLIKSGLDFLVISFDGASKSTYEKAHSQSNFEIPGASALALPSLWA